MHALVRTVLASSIVIGAAQTQPSVKPSDSSKLRPSLASAMRDAEPAELLPIVVVLQEQTPKARIDALSQIDE